MAEADEIAELRAANARLTMEVETLRGEFRALRGWYKAQLRLRADPGAAAADPPSEET